MYRSSLYKSNCRRSLIKTHICEENINCDGSTYRSIVHRAVPSAIMRGGDNGGGGADCASLSFQLKWLRQSIKYNRINCLLVYVCKIWFIVIFTKRTNSSTYFQLKKMCPILYITNYVSTNIYGPGHAYHETYTGSKYRQYLFEIRISLYIVFNVYSGINWLYNLSKMTKYFATIRKPVIDAKVT